MKYEEERKRKISERLNLPTKQPILDPDKIKQMEEEGIVKDKDK